MTDEAPVIITSHNRFGSDLPDVDVTPADPMELLTMWLPSNEDELRPLMTLTTLGDGGYPDSRNLLLSVFDGEALCFHTDSRTRKAAQLDADGRVSLALVWVELGRQLTVQGDAERMSAEEARLSYLKRSRYLQLLAWLNTNELARLPRAERVARWAAWDAAHPEEPLDAPDTWAGYRVVPRRLTFWRGDAEGPSNRIEYTRADGGWEAERLPG